jgi:ketosteroid isomerase-like protein
VRARILHLALAVHSLLSAPGTAAQAAEAAASESAPAAVSAHSHSSTLCKIECGEPLAMCTEGEKVIEVLKLLADAYARGDLTTYEKYLDDGCTTFDEASKRLIVGKQAVLEHLKERFQQFGPESETPLLSYKIEHPYARVNGDTAIVTFVAVTQVGGKHPYTAENHITDIFVRHGNTWRKLHYRGHWRKLG